MDNGVTVDLLNSQGKIVETTTTGIDYSSSTQQGGYYEFSGLAAGNYTVQFVAPHGESLTTEAANNVGASTFVPNGNPNTLVSDANQATGDTNTIVLASGQSVDNVDGGLTGHSDCGGLQGGNGNSCGGSPSTGGDNCSNGYPGSGSNSSGGDNCSISSQVWVDNSHCGVETSSDCGLAGITVKIEECINNVFQTIATTTTDNNGCYAFNNLEAGKYEVVAECANGYTYATENTACNGNQANSCVENTGCSGAINLTGGEQYFNANIGLCHTGFFG
ncbi:MAG: SdrD B-like domain-containing protein [Methylomonas sp.]